MNKKILLTMLLLGIVVLGTTACGSKKEESKKDKIDYLVLVNKENKLPDNWEETVELVEVKDFEGGTIKVEKEALEKFNELREALLKEDVDIELDSVYRSVKRQQEIWDEFTEEHGIEYTKNM